MCKLYQGAYASWKCSVLFWWPEISIEFRKPLSTTASMLHLTCDVCVCVWVCVYVLGHCHVKLKLVIDRCMQCHWIIAYSEDLDMKLA